MSEYISTDHIAWSQGHFRMLAEEGIWAIPRSGLVFTKRKGALVLTNAMPHEPGMPVSVAELHDYQRDDFQSVKRHFEAAGIPVTAEFQIGVDNHP